MPSASAKSPSEPEAPSQPAERHATWLELFFDLVFVAAIAQLAIVLEHDISWTGVGRFALLFVPVWWIWSNYTIVSDRFGWDDVPFRVALLAAMAGMAAVAVNVPDAFAGASAAFAVSYAVARVPLLLLWARALQTFPEVRPLSYASLQAFCTGTSLWAVSIVVPEPGRFAVWGAALAIELATPILRRRAFAGTPIHASHLAERWGLFTIVVLGEMVVAIVLGVGGADWGPGAAAVAALGFVAVAAVWWAYFAASSEEAVHRSLLARNTFIYGHLPLAFGLAVASVGIRETILHAAGETHGSGAVAAAGGLALALAAVALVRGVAPGVAAGAPRVAVAAVLAGAVAAGAAAGLGDVPAFALLAGVLTGAAVQRG
jgi:low temperature requirement protein LtrA